MNIVDLFDTLFLDEYELHEKGDGNFKTECPHCGKQGDREPGFILFTKSNTAYCHTSRRSFNMLELTALKLKIISCSEGRAKGEKTNLVGEKFIETIKMIEDEYGEEFLNELKEVCGLGDFYIRESIIHPGLNRLSSVFITELADKLKYKNTLFYRPDLKQVVEIRKMKVSEVSEIKQTSFSNITPNRFVTLVERFVKPQIIQKVSDGEGGMEKKYLDKTITSTLSAISLESSMLQDKLPSIKRIFTIPIPILYNGELTFPKVGYDKRFYSWLPYDTPKLDNPKMTLTVAKQIIEGLYKEFCFQDKQDKTNAIAALLTPYLRGLFETFHTRTPVTFYTANRERAGKDYCAGITGILYEGHAMEEPPISNQDKSSGGFNEELKKKLLAAMIQGRKRLHFSNNKGHLNNAVFEGIITAEKFSDRILGKNEILEFYNEIDFSLSGNIGITFTPDFANRSRFVRLFLEVEDANSRNFTNPNLQGWVKDNRGLILSALYSLVRNWVDKKHPKGTIPFTSFPQWAEVCGGIMEAAGYDSPCITDKEVLSLGGDKETKDMKKLFELCYEKYGDKDITKEEMRLIVVEEGDLFSNIDFAIHYGKIKFGEMINRFIGRYLSGLKLVVKNQEKRSSRWKYSFEKMECSQIEDLTTKISTELVVSGSQFPLRAKNNKFFIGLGVNRLPLTTKQNIDNDKKSDRKTQFWESEECKNIDIECSKDDVKKWLKNNPKGSDDDMYDALGIGCFKFKNELKMEETVTDNQ